MTMEEKQVITPATEVVKTPEAPAVQPTPPIITPAAVAPEPTPPPPPPTPPVVVEEKREAPKPQKAPEHKNVMPKFDPLRVTYGSSRAHLADLSNGAIVYVDGPTVRILMHTASEMEKAVFRNQFIARTVRAEDVQAEEARWQQEWADLREAIVGKQ